MERKDTKTLYACEIRDCRFLFESEKEPERCPDCGKKKIRLANEREKAEFEQRKKEFNGFEDIPACVDLQEKLSIALQEIDGGKVKSHEEVFGKYHR